MPYKGLKKFVECFMKTSGIEDIIDAFLIHDFERRRFAVNSQGQKITYDPVLGISKNLPDRYLSNIFKGKLEQSHEVNDSDSNYGGKPHDDKDMIQMLIKLDYDILEGDVIIFPVGSNKSYIVDKFVYDNDNTRKIMICSHNVRSTF